MLRKLCLLLFAFPCFAQVPPNYVSVNSYGAVSDCTTDNSTAFNNAVVAAQGLGYGVYVNLQSGACYSLLAPVNLLSGVNFQCAPGTIIQANAAYPTSYPVTFASPPTGTSSTLAASWPLPSQVWSVTFSDAEVRNITLTNAATTATWTLTLTGSPSVSAAASPNQLLMYGQSISNVTVSNCLFDGNDANYQTQVRMMFLTGANNVLFTNDTFQHNAGQGPTFSSVGGQPTVSSGVSYSTFNDIGLYNWTHSASNPNCVGVRQCPISVVGTAITFSNGDGSTSTGNFVNYNAITNVGSDGVDIQGMNGFTATGNTISLGLLGWEPYLVSQSLGVAGFYVFNNGAANSANVTLTNNAITGATGNCFDTAAVQTMTITGNTASGCGGAGVSLGADVNVTITGNTIQNNYQSVNFTAPNNWPNLGHQGGIAYSCGKPPCAGTNTNIQVNGNIISDTQVSQTQISPQWVSPGVRLVGVNFGCNTTL